MGALTYLKGHLSLSQLHCLEPSASEQREQAGPTGHAEPGLPSAVPASGLVPRAPRAPKATTPTACTEVASARDSFQNSKPERDCVDKSGELRELCGHCGNSPGSEGPLSALVCVPTHLHRVDWGSIQCSGLPASLQQLCSRAHSQAHFSRRKGVSSIHRALPHAPGLLIQSCYSSVDRGPDTFSTRSRFYRPPKPPCTQSSESPRLHKATSPGLEETAIIFRLINRNKHRKSNKMKTHRSI